MLPFNLIIPHMGMPAPATANGKPLAGAGLVTGLIPAKGIVQMPEGTAANEFLNLLAAQLAQINPGTPATPGDGQQATPASQTPPAAARNPGEVLEKVLSLLEQNGVTLTDNGNGTLTLSGTDGQTLTTDIPALKSLTPETLASFLAPVLPAVLPAENAGLLTQLLADAPDVPPDAATLEVLKEKLAALGLSHGKINHETLVTFKKELTESLKAEGYTPAEINRTMVALAKFLTAPGTPLPPALENANVTPEELAVILLDAAPDGSAGPIMAELTAENAAPLHMAEETPVATPLPGQRPASEKPQTKNVVAPTLVSAESLEHDNPVERILTLLGRPDHAERPERAATAQTNAQGPQPAQMPATPAPPQPAQTAKPIALPATAAAAIAAQGENAGNGPEFGGSGMNWNNGSAADDHGNMSLSRSAEQATADGRGLNNFAHNLRNTANGQITQMVNIGLMRGVTGKMSSLIVQLEPVELGKVEIRLKLDAKNAARVHMTVDKPETMALLQKDAVLLERTLREAGIETDEASLSFDLRQQNPGSEQREAFNHLLEMQGRDANNDNDSPPHGHGLLIAQMAVSLPGQISASGVNIMV